MNGNPRRVDPAPPHHPITIFNDLNMLKYIHLTRLALLLVAPFVMTACGSGGVAKAPAEGTVTYKGRPLAGGRSSSRPRPAPPRPTPLRPGRSKPAHSPSAPWSTAMARAGKYKVSVFSYGGSPAQEW